MKFHDVGAGRGITAALLMGALAAGSGLSHAQDTPAAPNEIAALRAQIEALQSRLDKIEADSKAQQEAATKVQQEAAKAGSPVTTKEKVVLSGLLQVHGLGFIGQDNAFPRRADTFRLRRGEMRLTAPSITKRISGTVMFDPTKTLSGSTNIAGGQNLNLRARDNILQEIMIAYQLAKNANSSHFVDVGQFKIPIGYEGDQVSSGGLQTVERALFFTQRDPSGSDSGYGDVRDTGAQLRGSLGQVDYRLGIFNGLGERQNAQAVTDNKAIVARLAYKPAGVPGLQLGVSGARGNNALGAGNRRFNRGLFNLYSAYKKDKLSFQAEYLEGNSQLRGGPAFSEIRGYYGSIGYLFAPKLEGVLRYDSLDTNRRAANAEVKDITLGLNYYIKGNNAKIQANIVRRNGAPGSPIADLRPDRTEIRTNFQVGF